MAYKRVSPMPVIEGGTGAQTLGLNGVLIGNTLGAVSVTTPGTTGQVLTGITGSAPIFQTPAGGSGITTLDGDIGSATGSTVTVYSGVDFGSPAGSSPNAGTTILFVGDEAGHIRLDVSDVNNNTVIGQLAGTNSGTPNTGGGNTGFGYFAMNGLGVTDEGSCAFGAEALQNGGTNCIAIGQSAGTNYVSGLSSNNIVIGSIGTSGASGEINIGAGTSLSNYIACYIGGIYGASVGSFIPSGPVYADENGTLGTINLSSMRFKKDVQDIGTRSSNIMSLRTVSFVGNKDTSNTIQYGLIAEEVHTVMPQLVVYDKVDNSPLAVKYQDLPMMILNELQKHNKTIQDLTTRLAKLEAAATVINKKGT